jgi:hypothetical protein
MKSVFNRASRRPSGFSRLAAGCVPIVAVTTLIATQSAASAAQAPVNLGTAASFAVLAGSTVTNTGPSIINGDLGVSPGTAVTGFPPGTLNGTQHDADAVALQAQSDLTSAYNDAASRTPATSVPADLSGESLAPGVYENATSLGLTGTVTLNAEGNPNAVFIFQAGSTLITGSGSHVALTGGAQACNVFWQVGSSATLGTNSTFDGNILALQSISVTTGASIDGRALARNGQVSLDDNTITAANCATTTPPPPPPTPTPTPTSTATSTPTAPPTPTPTSTATSTPTAPPVPVPPGVPPILSSIPPCLTWILSGIFPWLPHLPTPPGTPTPTCHCHKPPPTPRPTCHCHCHCHKPGWVPGSASFPMTG